MEYQISEAEDELEKVKKNVALQKKLDSVASEDFYYQVRQRVSLREEEKTKLINEWAKQSSQHRRSLNKSLKSAYIEVRTLKKSLRELKGRQRIHKQSRPNTTWNNK